MKVCQKLVIQITYYSTCGYVLFDFILFFYSFCFCHSQLGLPLSLFPSASLLLYPPPHSFPLCSSHSLCLPPTSASQVTMTRGVFSLPSRRVSVRACVSLRRRAVSLSLPPGSKEPPSSRLVIGQGEQAGRGALDTSAAALTAPGTCFNRWSRLESVITSESGLEERGCLPGAVWSPAPTTPPPSTPAPRR